MSYAICIATHILLMQKQLNATTVLSCSKLLYRKMLLQPLLNDAIIVSNIELYIVAACFFSF